MTFDDLPLFNTPSPAHNGTETSRDAAESIKPHLNALCLKVLAAVQQAPDGHTCEELEHLTGMKHQTCSARLNDLANCQPPLVTFDCNTPDGKPRRRRNTSGRTARIYFAAAHTPAYT